MRTLAFEELRADAKSNWIGNSANDFGDLLPIVATETKHAVSAAVKTNRDEWVYDFSAGAVEPKVRLLIDRFNAQRKKGLGDDSKLDYTIKWSSALKTRAEAMVFQSEKLVPSMWRPFVKSYYYSDKPLSDRLTKNHFDFFGADLQRAVPAIYLPTPPTSKPPQLLAISGVADYHVIGDATVIPREVGDETGACNNITDWALKQFQQHYRPGKGRKPAAITKEAVFHYVYAVLHDPVYREKYALNLKREFPRIPLYGSSLADFEAWAGWGAKLMALHIGYETVEPWTLTRSDTPDTKAREAKQSPKCILKSQPGTGTSPGRIVIDSETVLAGVPNEAWNYRLGNRSAIDWVLEQHKEKKPKDPTIREKFDTYRFADHKERVIDLLVRVVRVSVETVALVQALRDGPR